MTNRYRFIDYQRAAGAAQKEISLHQLYPEPEKDEAGRIVCIQPVVKKVSSHEVLKLFQPYVSMRFMEQFKAVVPLAAYLVLFQLIILRQVVEDSWIITGGLLAVILGLMFFMEGLKLGLMPFGTVIGATLPRKSPLGGVLILLLYVASTVTPAEIIAAAAGHAAVQAVGPAWYEHSPGQEILLGIRAILPLVLFLFLVLKVMLKEQLQHRSEIFLGIGLTMTGMCIFNLGLTYGLAKLGGSAGGLVPMAFMEVDGITGSPIYMYAVGLSLALLFAWVLGFGATIAEPALNALGITAEQLTNGVFKKRTLILAVSAGVAFGIAIGLVKIIFDLPLIWLILPGYLVAVVLTFFTTEEFVNVAWDSAGVTTGPITVPLVLAMGLGFGNATKAVEGFGILSIASIGPVITVMISGLWSRYRVNAEIRAATQGALAPNAEIAEVIV